MLEENALPRGGDPVPTPGGLRDLPPSAAAQQRLSAALRDRSQAYQHGASVDLTIMEALLRMDRPEAAARALEDHRAALQSMARELQVAVADAAVEREAERVCSAAEQAPPVRPMVSHLRRRALAVTGAAAVVVALVLPTARFAPRTTLTSVEHRATADDAAAARTLLAEARARAQALRDATTTTLSETRTAKAARASGEVVRDRVRAILAAGDPGGSAAPNVTDAQVMDLYAHRTKRPAGGRDDTPPAPPANPRPVDVRTPDVQAPLSPESVLPTQPAPDAGRAGDGADGADGAGDSAGDIAIPAPPEAP